MANRRALLATLVADKLQEPDGTWNPQSSSKDRDLRHARLLLHAIDG